MNSNVLEELIETDEKLYPPVSNVLKDVYSLARKVKRQYSNISKVNSVSEICRTYIEADQTDTAASSDLTELVSTFTAEAQMRLPTAVIHLERCVLWSTHAEFWRLKRTLLPADVAVVPLGPVETRLYNSLKPFIENHSGGILLTDYCDILIGKYPNLLRDLTYFQYLTLANKIEQQIASLVGTEGNSKPQTDSCDTGFPDLIAECFYPNLTPTLNQRRAMRVLLKKFGRKDEITPAIVQQLANSHEAQGPVVHLNWIQAFANDIIHEKQTQNSLTELSQLSSAVLVSTHQSFWDPKREAIEELPFPIAVKPNISRLLGAINRLGFAVIDWTLLLNLATCRTAGLEALTEKQRLTLGDFLLSAWSRATPPKIEGVLDAARVLEILGEHIDMFALDASERDRKILCGRLGYFQSVKTLNEVGAEIGVTRERVRQLESRLIKQLTNNLRPLLMASLQDFSRSKNLFDLSPELDRRSEQFGNKNLTFKLLVSICGELSDESLRAIDAAKSNKIKKQHLIDFFVSVRPPFLVAKLVDFLGEAGLSVPEVDQYLKSAKPFIQVNDDGTIQPTSELPFSARAASAHILLSYPRGLPWKDVATLVNASGLVRKEVNTTRLTNNLTGNEYVWVCGKGIYGNIVHANLTPDLIQSINKIAIRFLTESGATRAHLLDLFRMTSGELGSNISYWQFRYAVSEFGSDYGLFFLGSSRRETVAIQPIENSYTQRDLLIDKLKESPEGYTREELAGFIASKSKRHVSLYLSEIVAEGLAVRVSMNRYMNPEQAYKNINLNEFQLCLNEFLDTAPTLKHISAVTEFINKKLGLALDGDFYGGLISYMKDQAGWFRRRSIVSKTPIENDSATDVVKSLADTRLSLDENHSRVSAVLDIPRDVFPIVMRNSLYGIRS